MPAESISILICLKLRSWKSYRPSYYSVFSPVNNNCFLDSYEDELKYGKHLTQCMVNSNCSPAHHTCYHSEESDNASRLGSLNYHQNILDSN